MKTKLFLEIRYNRIWGGGENLEVNQIIQLLLAKTEIIPPPKFKCFSHIPVALTHKRKLLSDQGKISPSIPHKKKKNTHTLICLIM